MMRKVYTDEIHGLDFETMLSKEYLIEHVWSIFRDMCEAIHHVDTQLREENGKKLWRVQGYINVSDFEKLYELRPFNELPNCHISIEKDILAIYCCVLEYKE
jgi:hypothetical protein